MLAVLCAVLGGLLGGMLAVAPGASAASGGCPGRLVRTVGFTGGEVRVYKTRTHACALTVPHRHAGRQWMSVTLQPRGGAPVTDSGRFERFAGPVSAYALNRCVLVKGAVGTRSGASGWILC
ncbi:hypothetical protein ACN20G_17380 [Streptomyces sp. BI20]|uniref:hypothetical protein n=1 Tax=Streptomyces sp. BI20 TaxID=3403460 RepID=UPI003C741B42